MRPDRRREGSAARSISLRSSALFALSSRAMKYAAEMGQPAPHTVARVLP